MGTEYKQKTRFDFNKQLWTLGTKIEDAILPSINTKFDADFKRDQDIFDIIDFRDGDKKLACEIKGRRNTSSQYKDTIITLNKITKGWQMIDDGWDVYLIFVFTDKTMYHKLTGDENWKVKLTGTFGIEHYLIPVSELKDFEVEDDD